MSVAFDKTVFNGNTIWLIISEENDEHRYLYVRGDTICSFLTSDNIYKYISSMGNNLTPYGIAIGEENIYFLTPLLKFFKREKIDDNELLKTNKGNIDPFTYHVSNCGKCSFEKIRKYKLHSNYD